MLRGLEHVNQAVQILMGRNAMLNQRLYEAVGELEAALREPDQWPTELFDRAIRIDKKATAKGSAARTINGMDVPEAQHIAEEILDLSTAIDAACTGQRKMAAPTSRRLDTADKRRRLNRPVSLP